ncbi:hypothetical protein CC78DRAFT_200890 [Lojkania enalia]|uniref:UBX domain-containing protein 2 n=1 Tax=Lojkania enalia TaxID=147567 RepID=A0A9P4KA25_9PLEO|nr:hypothetical protein CC78DRAFT_200890 [Didymosphaeria enalia]
MFHEGTLQSGISLAIQEQKLVVCFVRDDNEESSTWENDWLQSGWVSSLLEQKAVVLRLQASTTEAGFLSAFCPISNIPTLVVIQNGQLCEQLMSGIGKDEFINRVRKVLGASAIPSVPQTSSSTPPPQTIPTLEPIAASTTPQSASPAPEERPPVSPILPPSSKAKGKQKVTPPDPKPGPASATAAQQAARDALRKKKQEEKDELARIQALIEADKAERKAQALARKAERERERETRSSPATSHLPVSSSSKGSLARDVHLNIRLFDGRTIRHVFPRTAKLQDDVRPWVDEQVVAAEEETGTRTRHPPYYFKQIMAPLPSRELSAKDESEMLGDIDLAPSATLILIPIKGFTEAYTGSGGGIVGGVVGGVTGLVGGVFGAAASAVGYVGSTLGAVVGYGASSPESPSSEGANHGRTLAEERVEASASGSASGIRVRTLADQRVGEDRTQQFYNGNQLDFESRDDEGGRG